METAEDQREGVGTAGQDGVGIWALLLTMDIMKLFLLGDLGLATRQVIISTL